MAKRRKRRAKTSKVRSSILNRDKYSEKTDAREEPMTGDKGKWGKRRGSAPIDHRTGAKNGSRRRFVRHVSAWR